MKAIIVDDDPVCRKWMTTIVESLGYSTAIFNSAESALRYINTSEEKIDIYILDVVLPKMTGIEMAEILKSKDANSNILIVSHYNPPSTASTVVKGSDPFIDRVNNVGGFIRKPFVPPVFIDAIRKLTS